MEKHLVTMRHGFIFASLYAKGRLAQLVQSTWFTPRGSEVRVLYRPQLEMRKPVILE